LVFSLGSSAVEVGGPFYALASQVSRRLQHRAVLVAGRFAAELGPDLPPSQIAVPWTCYSRLFPRAAAVIHHGGVGTTAEVLRAGVPQLVVPFAHDQFDNAHRVKRLGCGRFLPHSRVGPRSLERELRRLLEPTGAPRAKLLGEQVRQESGVAEAAKALIDTAKRLRG
jgi:UDP:flavonoid glycosyltransferase YjiC (YdhE family)